MQQNEVVIRGVDRLDKIDPRIVTALSELDYEESIPVYYTGGLMPEVPQLVSDPNWCIGIATHFKKNNAGDFVCDVTLNDFLSATANFAGVIDNIVCVGECVDKDGNKLKSVENLKEGSDYTLKIRVAQFHVYDLNMKNQFDQLMAEKEKNKDAVPMEGSVGAVRGDENPLKDPSVQAAIQADVEQAIENGGDEDGR